MNAYDDFPWLWAVKMKHNLDTVKISQSPVEVGDVLFFMNAETFPEGYSTKDVIRDVAGSELGIKGIDPIFDIAVIVTVVGSK